MTSFRNREFIVSIPTLAFHLLVLCTASALFESLFVPFGFNRLDEGWVLQAARQLHDGGTLYEDVFFVFPPGHLLPAWLGYAWSPPGLLPARWIYAALNVVLCACFYLLGRRLAAPRHAFVATLLLVFNSPTAHASHYLFAYRYVFWSLLALLAFDQWVRHDRARWIGAAGFLAGIGLCFRLTPAFAVSAGIATAILGHRRALAAWIRDSALYAIGLLLAAGPVIGWLLTSVGPAVLWSEVVVRPVEMTAEQSLPPPPLFLPTSLDRTELWRAFLALEFRIAPLVVLVVLVRVALEWLRDARAGRPHGRPLLLATAVFAAVFATRAFGRADESHLVSAIPAILLLVGPVLDGFERALVRRGYPSYRARAIAMGTGIFLLVGWMGAQRWDEWVLGGLRERSPGPGNMDRPMRKMAVPNPVPGGVRLLRRVTRPGDVVLDLSASPVLQVLANRRGPGGPELIMPGTFRNAQEEERFVARLEADPPAYVLTAVAPFDGLPERGVQRSAPLVWAWVQQNYLARHRGPFYVGLVPRPRDDHLREEPPASSGTGAPSSLRRP